MDIEYPDEPRCCNSKCGRSQFRLAGAAWGRMAEDRSAKRWPVQVAKSRFSELLEASLNEGPQILTREGVEIAVLIALEEWRRLQSSTRPTLKELLLAESPRAEIPVSSLRQRPPERLSVGPDRGADLEFPTREPHKPTDFES